MTEGRREPSAVSAALRGRCPRCGAGSLFDGYLRQARTCNQCGLDYSHLQAGDGPAVFVILIVGFLVSGSALLVEVAFQPPYWVHAALWAPAILILSLGLLRPLKAGLMVLQYKNRAEEGRLK